MSETTPSEPLAAILDALTIVQCQLEELGERTKRIEANQGEIMGGVARVAEVAGWAHAAARGSRAPLPADVLDDPLLERFVLGQPADPTSTRRELVDWRRISQGLDTERLIEILRRQYLPSPTDTAADRRLRFQLAAITREELEGRGATLPALPASSYPADRDDAARTARSAELARQWREGDEAALYAEPELAGAMDILGAAYREGAGMPAAELEAALSDLRRTIAERVEAGERLELASVEVGRGKQKTLSVRDERIR